MEKKYHKKNARLPTFFFLFDQTALRGSQKGRGRENTEREEKDKDEMDVYEGEGQEKEFSYRQIIPSHFLRRHLRRGSWLGLIKSQTNCQEWRLSFGKIR